MSDYIAHAEAEAAAYEKKRKKQLEDERKRLQAEAEAAHTAERDTAHATLKQATQTRRAAVDTAAVKAALTYPENYGFCRHCRRYCCGCSGP